MKKPLFVFAVAIFATLLLPFTIFAVSSRTVIDDARLLASSEIAVLESEISDYEARYNVYLRVVTLDMPSETDPDALADRLYIRYLGQSNVNGSLLMVNMGTRDITIMVGGDMKNSFSHSKQDSMVSQIKPYLTDKDYARAFDLFLGLMEEFTSKNLKSGGGEAAEPEAFEKKIFTAGCMLAVALAAGGVACLIVWSRYKVLKKQVTAQYLDRNSVAYRNNVDAFVGTRTTSTRIDSGSSGGGGNRSGSGGGSHSGSSGTRSSSGKF
ncbi:MAG: TPM domain-containing protein [Oscillospiraceae bacterium]|jgi:uncharacterized protein|nr:TPM domain-containing protein [Oscillospiraceae bacterium]